MRTSDVSSRGFGPAPSPPVGLSFHAKIRPRSEKARLRGSGEIDGNRFKICSLPSFCLCELQQRSAEILHFSFYYPGFFYGSRGRCIQQCDLTIFIHIWYTAYTIYVPIPLVKVNNKQWHIDNIAINYQLHIFMFWLKAHNRPGHICILNFLLLGDRIDGKLSLYTCWND